MLIKKLLLFALLNCLLFTACKKEQKNIKQTEVAFKKEGELTLYKLTTDSTTVFLDIEIADTEYERETGLMYRNTMLDSQGMLFVFEDESPRFFYMKNTRIPLDLIFLDSNKKMVRFQKNAKPFDESSLPSNVPAQYVLEVNAGLCDIWKLKVGDSISF